MPLSKKLYFFSIIVVAVDTQISNNKSKKTESKKTTMLTIKGQPHRFVGQNMKFIRTENKIYWQRSILKGINHFKLFRVC